MYKFLFAFFFQLLTRVFEAEEAEDGSRRKKAFYHETTSERENRNKEDLVRKL